MNTTVDAVTRFEQAAASAARVTRHLLAMAVEAGLIAPFGVSPFVGHIGPAVDLQTDPAEMDRWAERLDATLTTRLVPSSSPYGGHCHWSADTVIDGVLIHVGACQWLTAEDFHAALAAEAVAS
ncbi:hypothetical protein ACFWPV_10140 [Streptomyces uncialis]|uniref:hypothetical protein n=1 Tax=Streptomyces uncialis TaxID=1048205 RepID=UPI00365A13E4